MSTPKKTKFRVLMNLEEAIENMLDIGFTTAETKEVIRDMIKSLAKLKESEGK